MCDLHWLALAAPLQAAVLAKWHGRSTPEGDELARIAAAFGGEIVAVRPLRTDQHQGRV
jgi:hypothetical protein